MPSQRSQDEIRPATDEEIKRLLNRKPNLPSEQWDVYRQETRGDAESDPATEGMFDVLLGLVPFGKVFGTGAREANIAASKYGRNKLRELRKIEAAENLAKKMEPKTSTIREKLRVERLPTEKHTPEELEKWHNWAAYKQTEEGELVTPRHETPKQKEADRLRGVLKASTRTQYRRNPDTGEMELLLHRGVGPAELNKRMVDDMFTVDESLASMTPNKDIASDFASEYAGGQGSGTIVSAWVPESRVRSIPRQTGYRSRFAKLPEEIDSVIGDIPNDVMHYETIVGPGKYEPIPDTLFSTSKEPLKVSQAKELLDRDIKYLRGASEALWKFKPNNYLLDVPKTFSEFVDKELGPKGKTKLMAGMVKGNHISALDSIDNLFSEYKNRVDNINMAHTIVKSRVGVNDMNPHPVESSMVRNMAQWLRKKNPDFVEALKETVSASGGLQGTGLQGVTQLMRKRHPEMEDTVKEFEQIMEHMSDLAMKRYK